MRYYMMEHIKYQEQEVNHFSIINTQLTNINTQNLSLANALAYA